MTHPVEALRRIWTPGQEVEELFTDLSPQSEFDSLVRDLLFRTIQQRGPVTLDMDVLNSGNLRWEIVHYEPMPGRIGRREVSIWVEGGGSGTDNTG